MSLTVGSLCSGYEGIGLGLTTAGIEHRTAFVADPDRGASAVLAQRLPDVPNLGDITAVDWRTVMPVDLITAGYPCQPFSMAGKRKGTKDVRHLWPHIADAVRVVRPRWVLLENVAGHRSLGFGRVLADLAALGYVGSWRSVRASDVGAAHKRERVFILAWREGDSPAGLLGGVPAVRPGGRGGADPVLSPLLPTPTARDHKGPDCRGERSDGAARTPAQHSLPRVVLKLFKTPTAQLAVNGGSQHPDKRREGGHGPTLADQVEHLLPTPTVADSRGTRNATSGRKEGSQHHDGWTLGDIAYADRWGEFAPAILRQEVAFGAHAPEPTEPGRTGQRLSPRFVEWLMGVPAGWVTDLAGRTDALRLLGNGIVPHQLAHALHMLAAAYEPVAASS